MLKISRLKKFNDMSNIAIAIDIMRPRIAQLNMLLNLVVIMGDKNPKVINNIKFVIRCLIMAVVLNNVLGRLNEKNVMVNESIENLLFNGKNFIDINVRQ
ncbi:hypothetical protein BJV38_001526 [Clostridium beijerinckii]|uniref:hypothetical protein n=1 Tax=Clostridium beijerinckii TaxID=1520 RepID=UPI00157081A0|nr:hypothetical protein [Clostridium beijerinckii]NRT35890.1 hypothetical protein [Clostridium beijerinckii]NRT44683.1 hypothetical protein [Clostridium beijerinckii]NRZ21325.1 hypothetical protein [Clostridium beijerinckii]